MTDLHTHILPQADDGPGSIEETLRVLAMSYGQGFRTIVATPHYGKCMAYQKTEDLFPILEAVREAARDQFPDLTLELGQEIQYFEGITEALAAGEVLSLAGTRYVLVEFSGEASWNTLYRGVRKLLGAGYRPVVAHAERCRGLRKEGRLDELAASGAILQMNYESLTGKLWDSRVRWCRRQVLEGRIHILSTDCHDSHIRKPDTEQAMGWLRRACSEELVRELTAGNAETILREKCKGY